MKDKINLVLQILLGLAFIVFGLNKVFNFLPAPELPEAAGAFFGALFATGYMVKLIALTEVVGGALVLSRCYTPLGLVLLAPVSVNMVLFHVFLAPAGGGLAYVLAALNVYLLFQHLSKYRPMLSPCK